MLKTPSPVEQFVGRTIESLRTNTFVRLLLSQPVTGPGATAVERIIGRLVEIRGEPMLSLTVHEPTRDTTHNLPFGDVADWLSDNVPGRFRSAVLDTTTKSWQLVVSGRGIPRLVAHRPPTTATPSRSHDRQRSTLLGETAIPWLTHLGVCGPDGSVRASMADKHRQIERYLEILSHLVRDAGWQPGRVITVADMGCGKGYLTFGAWHLLNRVLEIEAEVTGVEARPHLVEGANAAARAVGASRLHFVAGTIAGVALPSPDALIALHACNTATDDAIRRGIHAGAKLIVVSPCCHQELRPQLGQPEPLAPLLRHGILAERMSEWLTDGLRALHLERAGYATKVMEFVGSEHTPRNLLIAGVRRDRASGAEAASEAIRALKDYFGIGRHALDDLLPPGSG